MAELTAAGRWALRSYRAEDAQALCELDELCFSPQFQIPRRAMRRDLASGDCLPVVAVDEAGERIGFAIARLVVSRGNRPLGYVLTLDVAPAWRGRGLGRALLQWLEAAVQAAGAAGLWLHVHTGNFSAVQLYERMGMQRERLDAGFYGVDEAGKAVDAWVYCKWFADSRSDAS